MDTSIIALLLYPSDTLIPRLLIILSFRFMSYSWIRYVIKLDNLQRLHQLWTYMARRKGHTLVITSYKSVTLHKVDVWTHFWITWHWNILVGLWDVTTNVNKPIARMQTIRNCIVRVKRTGLNTDIGIIHSFKIHLNPYYKTVVMFSCHTTVLDHPCSLYRRARNLRRRIIKQS